MAYKSKEQYPLINNPSKKTYCHIDPRSGRVCSVHFHKNALKHAVAPDPSWLQEQAWNDPFGSNDEWSLEVGGYDMSTLNTEFGISFEEMGRMQNFPPKRGVGALTDEANEAWLAYSDRSRRQYMDKDVKIGIIADRLASTEPEFRKLREELDKEKQNKQYPGNNQLGSDLPKSQRYYELVGKQAQIFEERANLYLEAAYLMDLDKSENEYIKRAVRTSGMHATTWHRDTDGIERTYWTQDFSQLTSTVDYYARSETVKAKYAAEKENYKSLAKIKNDNIRNHGTNDFENRIKPSPRLVEARVDFAIKKSIADKAQAAFDSSNIFNRRSRRKALSEAKAALSTANMTLNSRELE